MCRFGGKSEIFRCTFNRLREKTVGRLCCKNKNPPKVIRPPCQRAHNACMTRTQTRTYGVSNPSSRQLLLVAMLRVFVWLASNVVSKARTIFNRTTRDWHTGRTEEVQLPISTDIQKGTTALFPPSVRSTRGGGSPRLRGETACRAEAQRRWEGAAAPLSLSLPSFQAKAHPAEDPEPRSCTHHPHTKPVGSGSRASRASGMTMLVCSKVCANSA